MKNDLISRSALIDSLKHRTKINHDFARGMDEALEIVTDLIRDYRSVDAVEVVRCCECIYRDGTPGQPNILCYQMHDDDFCSYGERRADDGK